MLSPQRGKAGVAARGRDGGTMQADPGSVGLALPGVVSIVAA